MGKLSLIALPTPVYRLENLSRELKRSIWIKRDDLTGIEYSGNKARKLEYLFWQARAEHCDYVITTGGVQSNHARATAALAARLGLSCILFLTGEGDRAGGGNLLLDRLLGAEVIFTGPIEPAALERMMQEKKAALGAAGHRAYILPLGGSTPTGALGYMECMTEIERFESAEKVHFDLISHATGSGGTHAGLLLGNRARNIVSYSCSETAPYFVDAIYTIAKAVQPDIPKNRIHVVDDYRGPRYGESPPEALALIRHLAKIEGIVLDSCYTGKAFFGLVSDIKKGKYDACKEILFIHTGGLFALFADPAFTDTELEG